MPPTSGRRQLRLTLAPGSSREWLTAFPGATIVSDQADAVLIDLPADLDAFAVLDAARAATTVTDFGLDLPTLSQLFLAAAGPDGARQP